ncbi:hypothetical protein LXL04_007016 [Taraxacum kok-saghyz]
MKASYFSNSIFSYPCCHHLKCPWTTNLHYRAESFVVSAKRGSDGRKNIVDENMIVLRMRIREVEMEEIGDLPQTSQNWMGWEKRYYEQYNEDICEAMKVLQMCLMNTRPSLVLGVLILLMLSVTLSSGVVIYTFVSLVKWFL